MRQHARELLVYLAVHRRGADFTDIMEALWPNATLRRAGQRLSTDTADLRRHLRAAAGQTGRPGGAVQPRLEPVVNTGGRYHLNPDLVDIDLWRLDDALHAAAASTDPDTQIDHLRGAVDIHTGTLAGGNDYEWIDQAREHTRQQGIRARVRLAELVTDSDPHAAADLLHAAADLDPAHETLARRAMRASAELGDTDAVTDRFEQLRDALAAIDETPSAETFALAAALRQTYAGHATT